jgi:hypothetical protein
MLSLTEMRLGYLPKQLFMAIALTLAVPVDVLAQDAAEGQGAAAEAPPNDAVSDTPAAKSGSSSSDRDADAFDGEQQSPQAPKVKVERGAGGRKTFRITTAFVIEGRIQKPNAFYVLQRSQINYDWAKLKRDFIPRITEAVSGHPF